ncbi:MAG: hypothetical protein MJ053_05855 [Elusimicrobiaceae bacterium]|nr:hypothetical protein [Elusimicrobiaceae bacterium]
MKINANSMIHAIIIRTALFAMQGACVVIMQLAALLINFFEQKSGKLCMMCN